MAAHPCDRVAAPAVDATSRRWRSVALALLAGLCALPPSLLRVALERPGNIDDAFILLVYARHLAAHGAIYWNAADGHLDGATSFLDLLIKAAGIRAFPADPVLVTFYVTMGGVVLSVVAGVAIGWRMARAQGWATAQRAGCAFAAGLLLGTSRGLVEGASYLLETPLFLLVVLGVLYEVMNERPPSLARRVSFGAQLVLLALARPEGVVLACTAAVWDAYRRRGELSSKPLPRLLAPQLGALLVVAVYYGWRIRYFGYLAPNSYYAKTSSSRLREIVDGLHYLRQAAPAIDVAILMGVAAAGPLLALARSSWRGGAARRGFLFASVCAFASLLAVVVEGGDCYDGARFLAVPCGLAICVLLFAAVGLRPPGAMIARVLLILLAALQLWPLRQNFASATNTVRSWPISLNDFACDMAVGDALQSVLAGDDRMAQSDYQRFKFFSDHTRVVDMNALNDRVFAHEPWAGRVRFGKYLPGMGLRVDAPIWVYGFVPFAKVAMADVSLLRVFLDIPTSVLFGGYDTDATQLLPDPALAAEIARRYRPASVFVCGRYFNFLVREDLTERARAGGIRVGGR